jgi:5'(3')-deoxyribonucleotidase
VKITVIGIDVDEVCAALHRPWLEWIRQHFNAPDYLEFDSWNDPVERFGKQVFDFITPTVYHADIVKPITGALAAVQKIRRAGFQVRFITSCLNGTEEAKHAWLYRHGFTMDDEEFVPMSNKAEAPCHMLIDDSAANCQAFIDRDPENRVAMLVNCHHNRNDAWRFMRVDHLEDVALFLDVLKPQEGRMQINQDMLSRSNATSYTRDAALRIAEEIVPGVLKRNGGTISANDVRNHELYGAIFADVHLVPDEQSSAITLAFRLVGLKLTGLKTANRAATARYRKVSVWGLPAKA